MSSRFPILRTPESLQWERLYNHAVAMAEAEQPTSVPTWHRALSACWRKFADPRVVPNPLQPLDSIYEAISAAGELPLESHSGTSHGLQPPVLAWAEWEYFQHTGDDSRLGVVLKPLAKWFDVYTTSHLRKGDFLGWSEKESQLHGISRKDSHGCVDFASIAAFDCEALGAIALHMGDQEIAQNCGANFLTLKELVNDHHWNAFDGRYSDIDEDRLFFSQMSIGALMPLLANLVPGERLPTIRTALTSYRVFARNHQLPLLAGYEAGFDGTGGDDGKSAVYTEWNYLLWWGFNRGLLRDIAHPFAVQHVSMVAKVFEQTGHIWNCYAPDHVTPAKNTHQASMDLAGLSAIALMIEGVLGIHADGMLGVLNWNLFLEQEHGLQALRIGSTTASLHAVPEGKRWRIRIEVDGPLDVSIKSYGGTHCIDFMKAGVKEFSIEP